MLDKFSEIKFILLFAKQILYRGRYLTKIINYYL